MHKINTDGSVQGELFTKVNIEHPHPKYGHETYRQFHEHVNEASEKGYHKGDLSWNEWDIYCKGSGMYDLGNGDIFDADKII